MAGVEALISQGGLGEPTAGAPASTSAFPGLCTGGTRGLGLPTDPPAACNTKQAFTSFQQGYGHLRLYPCFPLTDFKGSQLLGMP